MEPSGTDNGLLSLHSSSHYSDFVSSHFQVYQMPTTLMQANPVTSSARTSSVLHGVHRHFGFDGQKEGHLTLSSLTGASYSVSLPVDHSYVCIWLTRPEGNHTELLTDVSCDLHHVPYSSTLSCTHTGLPSRLPFIWHYNCTCQAFIMVTGVLHTSYSN